MKLSILAINLFLISSLNFARAHEGHNHTPGAIAAPHGGNIKAVGHIFLELMVSGDDLKLYPYDGELKPIDLKEIKIDGSAAFPKKPKAEKVAFVEAGDAFSAKVEAKGAHRYTLETNVSYKGKKEKTKFNVEP